MNKEEHARRYIRTPKPESRIVDSYYYAYKDGVFIEEVRLTHDTKKRYEAMGYTFKRRKAAPGHA